jgi:hypothetical protein
VARSDVADESHAFCFLELVWCGSSVGRYLVIAFGAQTFLCVHDVSVWPCFGLLGHKVPKLLYEHFISVALLGPPLTLSGVGGSP